MARPKCTQIQPGSKFLAIHCGIVTILRRPRRIAGGTVVDVEGTLWNGNALRWSEPVENLRIIEDE